MTQTARPHPVRNPDSKTDMAPSDTSETTPARNPVRDRAAADAVQDRAESGPVRDRPESGTVRDRAESGPVRDRSESAPVRDRAESGPVRDRPEADAVRDVPTANRLDSPAPVPGGPDVGRERDNGTVGLARIAWLVTVLACVVTIVILMVEGYYGYALVTLAVAVSAGINLT